MSDADNCPDAGEAGKDAGISVLPWSLVDINTNCRKYVNMNIKLKNVWCAKQNKYQTFDWEASLVVANLPGG